MGTYSLRTYASHYAGASGDYSVVNALFGYRYGAPKAPISLKKQMNLLRGHCFDIEIIVVTEHLFSEGEFKIIEHAIQVARDIYATANIGIRQVYWSGLSQAAAGHYQVVDQQGAFSLATDFDGLRSNPIDVIDVFIVQRITDADGWAGPAPCGPTAAKWQDGIVVQFSNAPADPLTTTRPHAVELGAIMAHELGHWFGLQHCEPGRGPVDQQCAGSADNVMNTRNPEDLGFTLLPHQAEVVRAHCSVFDLPGDPPL